MKDEKAIRENKQLEFYIPDQNSNILITLLGEVNAGFPSPAGDYMELKIDLNRELTNNPDATFYARVKGNSMIDAGLNKGDLLVIDRSLEPATGNIALCYIDGEFTVKYLKIEKDVCWLVPANRSLSFRSATVFDFAVFAFVVFN